MLLNYRVLLIILSAIFLFTKTYLTMNYVGNPHAISKLWYDEFKTEKYNLL